MIDLEPLSAALFPDSALTILSISQGNDQILIVSARTTGGQPVCPCCQTVSTSLHSHYPRTLADLPCFGQGVQLQLCVRRFRCRERTCPRQVFCERLDGVALRSARMTQRLTDTLQGTALQSGASVGRRIGRTWGINRSRTTYLRVMRRMTPVPRIKPLRYIGVDDFAFKRGSLYGTLIIDLETGQPVEVLPDRTATTLAHWLRDHPELELATRDRSTEYARGLSEGAPQAQQVLDRWHLVKHLREALERQVQRHQKEMKLALVLEGEHTVLPLCPHSAEQSSQDVTMQKQAQYAELYAQFQRGHSIAAIVRATGVHRATVHRAIRCQGQVSRRRHARPAGILTPFQTILTERWEAGCRNASQLYRDLVQAGYAGSKRRVILWAQERREVPAPTTPGPFRTSALRNRRPEVGQSSSASSLTVKAASWLLFSLPEDVEEDQQGLIKRLQTCAPLRQAQELVHSFRTMLRTRHGESYPSWAEQVQASGLTDLINFAKGLQREGSALLAALTLPYSNGPTEGAVNRLKTIKRQMYGRAGFDLLRLRVLSG